MWQRTAQRKSSAFSKSAVLVLREHAQRYQFGRVADVVVVFRDPEQRMQVAQAALAFLDVRLDQIAGVAGLAVALVALGELGGDEFRAGAGDDFLVEARSRAPFPALQAADVAHLEDRGADRHVGLGQRDAFLDACGWRGRP